VTFSPPLSPRVQVQNRIADEDRAELDRSYLAAPFIFSFVVLFAVLLILPLISTLVLRRKYGIDTGEKDRDLALRRPWISAPKRSKTTAIVLGSFLVVLSSLLFFFMLIVIFHNVLHTLDLVFRITGGEFGPTGYVPVWMEPYVIDLSVVAPILVAFTSMCMIAGGMVLILPSLSRKKIFTCLFPFPTGYKPYYIQLGLLGTIFSFFILFLTLNPSSVKISAGEQTGVLWTSLGGALWSTFTGIALACVICPMIEAAYRSLARFRFGVLHPKHIGCSH
jgi:hypothetical protein